MLLVLARGCGGSEGAGVAFEQVSEVGVSGSHRLEPEFRPVQDSECLKQVVRFLHLGPQDTRRTLSYSLFCTGSQMGATGPGCSRGEPNGKGYVHL